MNKNNIMPVAVLTVICVIVAALLGAVNMFTSPVIDKMEEQKVYDSLREVLDGTFEPVDTLPANAPKSVNAMYKVTDGGELKGHVVTLTVKGYAGDISLTVGVDAEGNVTKAVVTSESESHGKAGMKDYPNNFEGVSADKVADVELFTGATVSSTAIKGAVIDAVNAVTGGTISSPDKGGDESVGTTPETLPKTDDEIISLAKALVSGSVGFENVTPSYNRPETLKRLYKETSGKGYVAYVVTAGQYVPVANEGLVHLNMDGDIENINHLTWIVGHGVSAEGFADKFVGKDNWSVDGVELISGATVTAGDFRSAVSDAVEVVTKLIDRTEKKILELADELVPNSKGFKELEIPSAAPETLKKLYKETSGKGYVAYIVTPGEYVAVATEGLVYFDTLGTIKDVDLLIWTVGHGVEPGDFAEGFVGKTEETVKDVELVTSATYTSADFKNAIIDAFPYIPKDFPIARVLGVVILCSAVALSAVMIIIYKKRRALK